MKVCQGADSELRSKSSKCDMKKFLHRIRDRANRNYVYSQPDFWDRKAVNYSDSRASQWPNQTLNELLHREHTDRLQTFLRGRKAGRALDVGCGTGRLARELHRAGWQVMGIDFSEKTLKIARKNSPREITFTRASVLEFISVEALDLILAVAVLTVACQTPEDLRRALGNIRSSLREEGFFLLIEPVHKGWLHRVLDMGRDDFRRELHHAGFEILEETQLHFWPTRLVLCHWNFWPWFTRAIYRLGEIVHRVVFRNSMGDYWWVICKVSRQQKG
jgi:SAM-dependent methyltransferase